MNWREAPLIRPLFFLVLGIVFTSNFYIISPFVYLLALLFLTIFALVLQFRLIKRSAQKYIGTLISALFFVLGCFIVSIQIADSNPSHISNLSTKKFQCIGEICSAPKINSKVQVHVSINKTVNQGLEEKAEGKLISFIPIDEKSKQLKYGDKIWLNIIINEIPFSTHESGFDFKKYYANKGIYHNAYVLDWDLIEKNTGIYSYILTQRDLLLRVLSEHLPTENEFAVGAALCLGNKELLSDELKNEFATVGAMHVLAVSGLHVGIIFSLLLKILSFFKTRKKLWVISKIAITVLCIWVFALLTGASPSVLRAAIMFSFITISLYSRRFRNTYNTLAAAALMLLIYDPYLLFDVGFQLSFTAVTGIVYLHPRIYKLLYFKWKVPDYFWQITSVGIAAQLATFPIGLYYFHHLPINFMLTGLFVVPFAFLILTLGIALFVTQLISSSLASLLGVLLYATIWINNALIHLVFSLPTNDIGHFVISGLGLVCIYCIYLFIDQYLKTTRSVFLYLTFGLLVLALFQF